MLAVWKRRAFRAWLVVALPLTLLCIYIAVSSHLEAESWNGQMRDLEKIYLENSDRGSVSKDSVWDRRNLAMTWRNESKQKSGQYAIYAIALVLLPAVAAIGFRLATWIWNVSDQGPSRQASAEVSTSTRLRINFTRKASIEIALAIFAVVGIGVIVVRNPEDALLDAIKGGGLAIGVWLLSRLRK